MEEAEARSRSAASQFDERADDADLTGIRANSRRQFPVPSCVNLVPKTYNLAWSRMGAWLITLPSQNDR